MTTDQSRDVAATTVPLVLRVFDHQIVGPDGELLGNVDDLVLHEEPGGELVVAGLVSGLAGLAQRQPGILGDWMDAIWRRLHPDEDPRAVVLPWRHVIAIESALRVDSTAERLLAEDMRLELWLRRYVVSKLPGATGGEHRLGGDLAESATEHPELAMTDEDRPLSALLGAQVRDATGASLGHVLEVVCRAAPSPDAVGPLVVSRVVYGRRQLGAALGYTVDAQMGPWAINRAMRTWHAADRSVEVAHVDNIDWSERIVTLSSAARPRHPHETT